MIETIENINQTCVLISLVMILFIKFRADDSVSDTEKYVSVLLLLAAAFISVVSALLLIWY